MRTRTAKVVVGAVLVALAAGCAPRAGADVAPAAESEVVVDPVTEIDGAEPYAFGGVTILVPEEYEATETVLSDEVVQLVLARAGEPRADVVATVTAGQVDDAGVEAAAAATRAQVLASGSFTEESSATGSWPGLATATVLRGSLTLDEGDREVEVVTTRTPDGDLMVALSAEAPAGQLDGSLALDVVRSVQVDR